MDENKYRIYKSGRGELLDFFERDERKALKHAKDGKQVFFEINSDLDSVL